MPAPLPENEFDRIIDLAELDLDYSDLEQDMHDLTKLAAHIAGAEVSLINLIDSCTQWSVSSHGTDLKQMPREDSVCQYTILKNQSYEVTNLSEDERFKEKSYVHDGPKFNYYYGIPLTTKSGVNIGALCVVDASIQDISPEAREQLALVANEVIHRLESLRTIRALETKVRELRESTYKVSHDIRSPLSGIIGMADIIKEEIKNQQFNELPELIEMMQSGSKSLLDLADNILKENASLIDQAPHPFNCETFAEKLSELYLPQATTKGVKLTVRAQDHYKKAPIPKTYLMQIAGNLISNSIKFTPANGEVNVDLSIGPAIRKDSSTALIIDIEDTGTGMSDEKVQSILNDDCQSELGTDGETGHGFGLSLVMRLIQQLNGTIDIQSEPTKGTHFKLNIPLPSRPSPKPAAAR